MTFAEGRKLYPHIQAALSSTGASSFVKHTKFLLPELTARQALLDRHPRAHCFPPPLLLSYCIVPHLDDSSFRCLSAEFGINP